MDMSFLNPPKLQAYPAAQIMITPIKAPPKAPHFLAAVMRTTDPPKTKAIETAVIAQRE